MQVVIEENKSVLFPSKEIRSLQALEDPVLLDKELNRRSLLNFVKYFWPVVSNDEFVMNWHIEFLCKEFQEMAEKVGRKSRKEYDLLVNIPPGTTKTKLACVFFPVWCWTRWFWMKFITSSYSASLALESAEESRDLIRSSLFQDMYPELEIKEDKDTKSNYKIVKKRLWDEKGNPLKDPVKILGGNRFSTSVGGTVTGFHGHILIWDDPLNPHQAVSEMERETANRWVDHTLSQRKTDKRTSVTIGIMQRLHQNDPSGHLLAKKKTNMKYICLPGQIRDYANNVYPSELKKYYIDGLLDPIRMPWPVLEEMETDLGQYGYAGQVGQKPTPPSGGMFKVDFVPIASSMIDDSFIEESVRFWDKAGTEEVVKRAGKGAAYTVGCKMHRLKSGKWLISDIKRGRWESSDREAIILATAEADGVKVKIYHEQEPGSGGKQSAQQTTIMLAGFSVREDLPRGNKIFRADPFSVQVNRGNVLLLQGDWNKDFLEELALFPFGTYKDQVDAASGAFSKLMVKREIKIH